MSLKRLPFTWDPNRRVFGVVRELQARPRYRLHVDLVEAREPRPARMAIAVLLELTPHVRDRRAGEVRELRVDLCHARLEGRDLAAVALDVVGRDAADARSRSRRFTSSSTMGRTKSALWVAMPFMTTSRHAPRRWSCLLDPLVDALLDEDLLESQPVLAVESSWLALPLELGTLSCSRSCSVVAREHLGDGQSWTGLRSSITTTFEETETLQSVYA